MAEAFVGPGRPGDAPIGPVVVIDGWGRLTVAVDPGLDAAERAREAIREFLVLRDALAPGQIIAVEPVGFEAGQRVVFREVD